MEFPSQGIIAEELCLLLGCFGFEQGGETPYGFFDAIVGWSELQRSIKCFQVLTEFVEEGLAIVP